MDMAQFTLSAHWASVGGISAGAVLALAGNLSSAALVRKLAVAAAAAGLGAMSLLLAARWYSAGYLPVTGLFSTLHFLSIWVVAISLYFVKRYRAEPFFFAPLALAAGALIFATKGDMTLKPLYPSLDTPLFFLHVSTSFAAYGLFGVAAILGVFRLIGANGSDLGMERRMLDEAIYIGYILFSWCMIAGSIWAYLAWGSYWTWRTKGLWSTILWFYYSGVVHLRNRPEWQGWPINVLAIAGFGLVLFTFLGLGLLFDTSHPLK